MRWLLLPLLLVALLAPREPCETRALVPFVAANAPPGTAPELLLPPLRAGHPAAPLGTDRLGRDQGCLAARGLARSLALAALVLALGVLPGLLLGLWLAWTGRAPSLPGEALVLLALVLLFGREAFRLVLVLGVTLLTARLVATRARTVLREVFVEGALALGARPAEVLRRHVWPHLRPSLPTVLATALSGVFLWLMELGILGFYDQPILRVAFSDGYDLVPDIVEVPASADLGQLVAVARWTWLDSPEGLIWPVLLLALLSLALKDLARWLGGRAAAGKPSKP